MKKERTCRNTSPEMSFTIDTYLLLKTFPNLCFQMLRRQIHHQGDSQIRRISIHIAVITRVEESSMYGFAYFRRSFTPGSSRCFISQYIRDAGSRLQTVNPVAIVEEQCLPGIPQGFSLFLHSRAFCPGIRPKPVS